jgi:hypothetical protein
MTDSDLTLKVLVEMRDELRALGQVRDEVRGLRHEAVQTNQRLDVIEHTLADFGTQVVILGRYMKNSVSRHGGDIERHEDEIADLRTRVEKLETKS